MILIREYFINYENHLLKGQMVYANQIELL